MKLRLLFLIPVLLVASCKKNRTHPVPSLPFDIIVNMSLPSYVPLQGAGGWAYVSGGSKGIIIYRRSYDDFVAFDRHSPAPGGTECATPLTPDSTNFLELNDVCSGARFSLFDGSPISGSELGLRQYPVVWDGNYTLRVYN